MKKNQKPAVEKPKEGERRTDRLKGNAKPRVELGFGDEQVSQGYQPPSTKAEQPPAK